MTLVPLADLAGYPGPDASQRAWARYRLLASVAARLGITDPDPTEREWRIAAVTVDDLPALRDTITKVGERTDRRPVPVGAGRRFQTIRRHPAHAVAEILARIDGHLPENDGA